MDLGEVERERNQSLESLSKDLPRDEMKPLIKKSLEYRLGRIPADDYFLYLSGVLGPERLKNYPQLNRYIRMSRIHSRMDTHATLDELTLLQKNLTDAVFQTPDEKSFLELINITELIGKMTGCKNQRS